jgi:hypothetical protein
MYLVASDDEFVAEILDRVAHRDLQAAIVFDEKNAFLPGLHHGHPA